MKVDRQLVSQVAKLAHLKLSDDEVSFYQNQLEKILDYVQQLNALNAKPLSPERSEGAQIAVERTDIVQASVGAEQAVSQAPEHSGTYFQVPRIIE